MKEAPVFFVPLELEENQEKIYTNLAKFCDRDVPEDGKRIYSITYVHNSEKWTATVGENLKGIPHRKSKSRNQSFGKNTQLFDKAIVLAIFPGSPYVVVTNHRITKNVGSMWENPFYVGSPKNTVYFSG